MSKPDPALAPTEQRMPTERRAVPKASSRCRCAAAAALPEVRDEGACPPYLRLRASASPGLPPRASCAVGEAPCCRPATRGGVGRRAGIGGPAGAQVSSFINTRTGPPRGQRPSSRRRRRRQTRRCHCRCPLRVTTGSPVRPGPPKSTPLSISGAPRRSSSLRGLTVGCSFHTRPWRPSERPGKPLWRARLSPAHFPRPFPLRLP